LLKDYETKRLEGNKMGT